MCVGGGGGGGWGGGGGGGGGGGVYIIPLPLSRLLLQLYTSVLFSAFMVYLMGREATTNI